MTLSFSLVCENLQYHSHEPVQNEFITVLAKFVPGILNLIRLLTTVDAAPVKHSASVKFLGVSISLSGCSSPSEHSNQTLNLARRLSHMLWYIKMRILSVASDSIM
jgi:hypothetical protein